MTGTLTVRDLCVTLGSFSIRNICLDVHAGEYFVLLGPTGSGKTILLETIAGLYSVQKGAITLDGRDITRISSRERHIGMVYQDYMLFPHLSVFDNIAFGLRRSKTQNDEITRRVTEISSLLQIESLFARYPDTLSGGEQQRTALARALVMKPSVLLLDEPLSALDIRTRMLMYGELRRIHRTFHTTILHITHHFEDVYALADRVAIMHDGMIEQTGRPEEVFSRPVNEFVAGFVGTENILAGSVESEDQGLLRIRIGSSVVVAIGHETGEVQVIIRPEVIIISPDIVLSSAQNSLKAHVTGIVFSGPLVRIAIDAGFPLLVVLTRQSFTELDIKMGDTIYATFKASAVHVIGT